MELVQRLRLLPPAAKTRDPWASWGVPGTDVEIGGVSLVLEPDRGNPTSKRARARPGVHRAVPVRPVWRCGASVRAGLKEAIDVSW